MDVSVIIINYKTPDLVIDCVNSIKSFTKDISYEIIVVDNDSRDNSAEILKRELQSDIKLIESPVNLGFGKANNLAVKHAKGDYVFLLNSDTILINNAIKILYDYIVKSMDVGVVGGNLYSIDFKANSSFSLNFDDISTVKSQSRWVHIIREIICRQYRQRFYSEEQKHNYIYKNTFNYTSKPKEVAYIFGTDMMLPRSLYQEMNGFDPDFFMYAEEEELSWRIRKNGYKIVNVPSAKIIHLDGATFKRDNSFNLKQFEMRTTGAMIYYDKRFGEKGRIIYLSHKMLYFKRQYFLAKVFRKHALENLTKQQIECLKHLQKNWRDK